MSVEEFPDGEWRSSGGPGVRGPLAPMRTPLTPAASSEVVVVEEHEQEEDVEESNALPEAGGEGLAVSRRRRIVGGAELARPSGQGDEGELDEGCDCCCCWSDERSGSEWWW